MVRTLGRLIWLPIAFLISACVAFSVLVTLGLEKVTHAMHGQDGPEVVASAVDMVWQGTLLAAGATLIPALLIVIVGEVARIRSWLYYLIGGGIAMAALPLLARFNAAAATGLAEPAIWQVFATAGFAGGTVYWLLAGRNA